MFRFSFMSREEKFFELFEASSRNIVEAAYTLEEMIDKWEDVERKVSEITELEHKGDTFVHQIMELSHRTFVTPFDREDIAILAHSLDDVIDFIQAAAEGMLIYKISHPTEKAKKLAETIVQSAFEIEKAMPKLRHRARLKQVLEQCVEINRLENTADDIYRSAVAELFCDTMSIIEVIKWREIYEQMESATDRCEDVSNVLEGVALKHG